jgi:hypothetical protein
MVYALCELTEEDVKIEEGSINQAIDSYKSVIFKQTSRQIYKK